jgi:uncharacterized protein (DUF488 family)
MADRGARPTIATIGIYCFDAETFVILAPEYVRRYTEEILDATPLEPLLEEVNEHSQAALLCVECAAAACHRSLITQRLADRYRFSVRHLLPLDA